MLKINLLLNTFQLLHITCTVDENSIGALKMEINFCGIKLFFFHCCDRNIGLNLLCLICVISSLPFFLSKDIPFQTIAIERKLVTPIAVPTAGENIIATTKKRNN